MPRIITLTPNPTFDFAVDADFVEPNRKLRCKNPASHPGGGGINVARATTRLGAETLAIFTAGGLYGDALKAAMAEEGVKMRVVPVQGATRLAFHVMELAKGDEYRFNLPGAPMSGEEAKRLLDALAEETAPGDYVAGSGSLPPGAGDDFWARAARIAKESEAKFVLDSIHGLEAALKEGVFLLRQNQHEYTALAGGARDWPDGVTAFAEEIVQKGGAARMVITHGGDGSVMATRGAPTVRTPALEVRAHSAVGAGDSFVGGLIAAFLRGDDDQTALRYAAACAAATRMSPGKSLFDPRDVKTLFGA
jgi:6-phosphofructokinase 2